MHPMPLGEVSSTSYNANAHFDLFGVNDAELNPWPVHSQNVKFQLFETQGNASSLSEMDTSMLNRVESELPGDMRTKREHHCSHCGHLGKKRDHRRL